MRKPLLIVLAALVLGACAGGAALRTEGFHERDRVSGAFDVILYGGTYLDDFEAVAILDVAGDGYEFVPFAPDFRFKKMGGLQAKDAMGEALHHVSFHRFRSGTGMRRVLGESGETVAYEMRPLYSATIVGMHDVLEVDYWLKEGGRVKVEVRLDPGFEKRLRDSSGEGFIFGH